MERMTWVWNHDDWDTPKACDDLVSFAARRGFTGLWVQIGFTEGALRQPAELRNLLAAAGERGIRVHALMGSSEMALRRDHDKVVRRLETVARFDSTTRFAGLHLDIEPHTHELYKTNRDMQTAVWTEYTELLHKVGARARELGLRCGADTVHWLHGHQTHEHEPVLTQVLKALDDITIMAYNNQAERIVRWSAISLGYATLHKKQAYVAIETSPLPERPQETFAKSGPAAVDAALATVERSFKTLPGFAGVAIHHYRSYRTLLGRAAAISTRDQARVRPL